MSRCLFLLRRAEKHPTLPVYLKYLPSPKSWVKDSSRCCPTVYCLLLYSYKYVYVYVPENFCKNIYVIAMTVFQQSVETYTGVIKISWTEIVNCFILTDSSTMVRVVEYTNLVLSLETRSYVEGTVLHIRQTLRCNLGNPVWKHCKLACLVPTDNTLRWPPKIF